MRNKAAVAAFQNVLRAKGFLCFYNSTSISKLICFINVPIISNIFKDSLGLSWNDGNARPKTGKFSSVFIHPH